MPPQLHPIASQTSPEAARGRAPLNSVSTRIILCVFVSTLLTALIVSWLSVGAIHRDARAQAAQRGRHLVEERAGVIANWHSTAAAQLAASTAIGTPWHRALIASLDADAATRTRSWLSDPSSVSKFPPLPAPPPELARHFDRIMFTRSGKGPVPAAGCLPASVDIIQNDSRVAGHIDACLSRALLGDALQPPRTAARLTQSWLGQDTTDGPTLGPVLSALQGVRMLITDGDGVVANAGGSRSQARIGETIPLTQLLFPTDGHLATYENEEGARLIGTTTQIGRTGWFIVSESDYARAFAPSIAITNQIFIVDVCIILLFSVLAFKITQAILQPIDALSRGAERIAKGQVDYEIPMPVNSDDELGVLTHSFNSMMRALRSNQLEIENDRVRLEEKNEELQRANEILAQLSITDGLTKLHNHRYFQDHLTREIKRVSRTNAPLSLILIDIDDFKLLNDTHGHAAGDEVLVSLAAIMNDSARESDLIARYGGEEFVILMPNTDLAGAVHLAEKVRMTVESTRLIIGDSMKPIDVTISLGVALFNGNRREFFAEADKALYQAKDTGKNCVIIAGSEALEAE